MSVAGRTLLILTEGGREQGLGHVVRCSAHAEAWVRAGGAVRWVVDGDDLARAALPGGANVVMDNWRIDPPITLADAVLVDSYALTPAGRAAIAHQARAPVFMEDAGRDLYPRGLVVDARLGARPPVDTRAEWLCGSHWQALRAPFLDGGPRPVVETPGRVLVLMGGTDPRGLATRMAHAVRAALPEAAIEGVGVLVDPPSGATAHGPLDAPAMARLMRDCDLAVSAAGQSVFELAVCGVPTILIQVADNQAPNMADWPGEVGFLAAGAWDDPDLDACVADAVRTLTPRAIRTTIAGRAQGIVDGRGGDRLIARIAAMLDGDT